MEGTLGPDTVSTKLEKIATLARKAPDRAITTLAHHIDIEFLQEAYRRTRKDGAPGVDRQTAEQYAENLEENLRLLLERFKSGTYKAPPARRAYIPKGDGKKNQKQRPIGIPTFEDKILQRAVAMVLEAVYEQDFLDCSYGFRPGRSPHQALQAMWQGLMEMKGGWVIELDIKSFFDEMDHRHLRGFLDQRVRDGVLRRAIDKWLKAGVLEGGQIEYPEKGSPQGGVVSPILSNIYLHEVLDVWFEKTVRPRLKGRAFLVRYADDCAIVCSQAEDARRVLEVLHKRFARYGLTLHPEKTRMISFKRPLSHGKDSKGQATIDSLSFDLLGFTHYWGKSLRGNWVVKRKTSKGRLSRALKKINIWCRQFRHAKVKWQHEQLVLKMRGHYTYYGITGNMRSLLGFQRGVEELWRKWLSRRSQLAKINWDIYVRHLRRYPLPRAAVVHAAPRP